ncbi:MAG: hypothetical protein JXQ73_34030 [Phycisphaerae bacterium]|nr:hypothetical protein [Phycisphaerae bacterium]
MSCWLSVGMLLAVSVVSDQPTSKPVVANGGFEQAQGGLPLDWSPVVQDPANRYDLSADAHTGSRALRLLRAVDRGEVGFNRAWAPSAGKQGAMLAERKGGLVFWYKVLRLSADGEMELMAIPMNALPIEETSAQRTIFTVPRTHVADGQWHRAVFKYDYSGNPEVKWVHVAGRLNTGTGEVLIDDVTYLPKVGPLVDVDPLDITTLGKPEDLRFRASCKVVNRGDEPAQGLAIALAAPKSCSITSQSESCGLKALAVDETQTLSWELKGPRSPGDKLVVTIQGPNASASQTAELKPELTVRFVPQQSILLGDGPTKVTAHIENTGTAAARDIRWLVALAPPRCLKLSGALAPWKAKPALLPGQIKQPTWQLEPLQANARAMAVLTVHSPDTPLAVDRQEFVCLAGVGQDRPGDRSWRAGPIELLFHGSPLGFGATSVRIARPGESPANPYLLARIPRAARLVLPGKTPASAPATDADSDEIIDFFGPLTTTEHEARITAERVDAAGATWKLTVRFTPGPAEGLLRVSHELHCDRNRAVRAFEGLILWPGEGSFGAKKRDAVVPGIEWLVGDEISSSDLDFAPGHKHRTRYVPHPNELTWPIMALAQDRFGIGLMWDPRQPFDGQRWGPQPVFASPDHFSHRNHHLMGLMLPTVREMNVRNVRRSPEPIALQAGTRWTMTADLWVSADAPDSLAALDTWMNVNGLPKPLDPPRGQWAKEIGFSMIAYLDTLYVPDADGWHSSVGGPGSLQGKPSPQPNYGFDVWMGSHLAGDAKVREPCKAMVDRMFFKRNVPVGADDLGMIMGRPDRMLEHRSAGVAQLIQEQGPDGQWRFDADLVDTGVFKGFDYHELGQDNAVELGTCARKAYEILLLARLTGDRRAYLAGLKTLAFMKRFEVPRAAQVWEVPVHSPDILAAADAVDAYLEAYRVDGNREHLTQAVRWARAGLPFVYVWQAPEYPWMLYGSIPVFGASWMKWSWIANIVQWNGLRYAYALIKLSDLDQSRPWRKIAEGLTVSAMYQQHTDGPRKALWPDSIRVDEAGRSNWEFAPRLILKNVYALMGRDAEPATKRADGFVISAVGKIGDVRRVGKDLNVDVEIPGPYSTWLVVAGATRPAAVSDRGEALKPLPDDTTRLTQSGYLYRPGLNLLMVALPSPGKHKVTVAGIEPRPTEILPETRTTIDFKFDKGAEGWRGAHHVGDLGVKDGCLVFTTTGGDPYIRRPGLRIAPDTVKEIVIRMQVDKGANAQLYWTTAASPSEDEHKVIVFKLAPGQMKDYRLPVGDHPHWKGQQITGLRLDPGDQDQVSVWIDEIR